MVQIWPAHYQCYAKEVTTADWMLKNRVGLQLVNDAVNLTDDCVLDNAALDYNDIADPQSQLGDAEESVYEYPFVPKELSNAIFARRLRKRGIIEECCLNPCSIWELSLYCK